MVTARETNSPAWVLMSCNEASAVALSLMRRRMLPPAPQVTLRHGWPSTLAAVAAAPRLRRQRLGSRRQLLAPAAPRTAPHLTASRPRRPPSAPDPLAGQRPAAGAILSAVHRCFTASLRISKAVRSLLRMPEWCSSSECPCLMTYGADSLSDAMAVDVDRMSLMPSHR